MTTQFAKASYQEIVDLHTEEDTVSVIGIHTPQGDTPRKMFGGFFDQFKKFKYLGCSVSLVPAARLPADPSQVSYEAGEQYIDPRDMLNPLMFHGCHGNDMGVILNRFYNLNSLEDVRSSDSIFQYEDSITDIQSAGKFTGLQLEDLYYKALTDNTWKKAHPQRGFKKAGLRPLVYSMATNLQFNGSAIGMADVGIPIDQINDGTISGQDISGTFPVSQAGRRFFTPRLTGLGWLDTRNVMTTAVSAEGKTYDITGFLGDAALLQQDASEADLPLVYMGMILLPPAYKTEQYFRMIINHHFAFKDFRGISLSASPATAPGYSDFNQDDPTGIVTVNYSTAVTDYDYIRFTVFTADPYTYVTDKQVDIVSSGSVTFEDLPYGNYSLSATLGVESGGRIYWASGMCTPRLFTVEAPGVNFSTTITEG